MFWRSIFSIPLFIVEGIISLCLSVLVIPVLVLLWILNSSIRGVVALRLRCERSRKLRLTQNGLDNIWGYAGNKNSRTVLNVVVYSGKIDGERYRRLFQERVIDYRTSGGWEPYRKLRERFVAHSGYYCWEEDENFDIKNHVVILPDDQVMTEDGLMDLLSNLSDDISSQHPQWQEVIVPSFKYNSRNQQNQPIQSVRILRFHHAYGDGGSWLLLYSHCLAQGQIPYAVNPLEAYPVPPIQKFLYYASAIIFGVTTMIRNFWFGTVTRSNRLVTPKYSGQRSFAWRSIQLQMLKDIKFQTRTSIPSVLTCAIASALRRFDAAFPIPNGSIGEVTDCGAVAAILPYPDLELTNRFTIANLTIPTGKEVSRKDRLARTHKACVKLSRSPEPILNFWAISFFGHFPIPIQNFLMKSAGTPLVFSNLPGAAKSFSLLGDSVEAGGAWIPLLTCAGLTLSAAGYCGTIRLCGATDSACMSHAQLEFLLDTILDEVNQMHWEVYGSV